ncbi:MAG: PDZ domain-containing protein, partial [bacterium]
NRREYGYDAESRGMIIKRIVPNSCAEEAGLKPGDLILEIDHPTPNREMYMARIQELSMRVDKKREITVLLHVDRAGETDDFPRYFSLKVRAPEK